MKKLLLAAAATFAISGTALAGPFIIDGTDADDHGFASGGANVDGWLYIQKGLENIAAGSGLTRTQKTIAVLGSDSGGTAAQAVQSSVALSAALSAAGWNVVLLNDSQITDFFTNTGSGLKSTDASVIYMDSTSNNVGGGLNGAEQAIIDGFGSEINTFLGSGGGLFSHSQGYGWLTTLIPGLAVSFTSGSGINLTPAGNTNFPGLTDADLSTGPYHNTFTSTAGVPVLGLEAFPGGQAVILGGAGGSITDPNTGAVPEASTWMMMLAGFGIVGGALRARRRNVSVSFG